MGWERSNLPGALHMSPRHDCPPPFEAAPNTSHIRLSGHRAINRTKRKVPPDVII